LLHFMKSLFLLLFIILFSIKSSYSQIEPTYYSTLSFGYGFGSFRDFTTSPLLYYGFTSNFGLERFKYYKNKELSFGVAFLNGNFNHSIPSYSSVSELKRISFYFAKLYPITTKEEKKVKLQFGGQIKLDSNLRTNGSFGNAQLGIEAFYSLMGSFQMKTDVSRKKLKEKKLLFIRYKLYPLKKRLYWRFNLGLLNNSFRNPFNSISHSGLLPNGKILDDFKFNLFSGSRFSSILKYHRFFSNKNRIGISYKWELWTSSKNEYNPFVMTQHILSLTYLFHTPLKNEK